MISTLLRGGAAALLLCTAALAAGCDTYGFDDDELPPPSVAECSATSLHLSPGERVTVSATVSDADSVRIDFGDGTTATALPASHRYDAQGLFTITLTATNSLGADTCTLAVTVTDALCRSVTELNSAFFSTGSSNLSSDALGRLDENVGILRRCPTRSVRTEGFSDGEEPDGQAVSQARARVVADYYLSQGVASAQIGTTVGLGTDPNSNTEEDPGPGDSRARRADSILNM